MKRNDAPTGGAAALNAFLDQGSSFEGKLTYKGAVRIDGRFGGEIVSSDTLYVGETGEIEGTIRVGEAIVSGNVRGTLVVERRLKLLATARVEGDVQTGALVVEEGASLDGRIVMLNAGTAAEKSHLESAVKAALDGKPGQAG